ncbi:hypothetical protein HZS_5800 [Henneguya salminicola]|nr:hypothetical protein HZS_5800 [Henneguya salminicola]
MAKHTKKVGICGKYATRYGSSLRKSVKKFEIEQHSIYPCMFCGKISMKRQAVGIWGCKRCNRTIAGGAWTPTTQTALTAKSTLRRIRDIK